MTTSRPAIRHWCFTTTGSYNVASGSSALQTNTTGHDNLAAGYQALFSNTTASSNVAVGN